MTNGVEGDPESEKQPIYKNKWFWIIIAVLTLIGGIQSVFNQNENDDNSDLIASKTTTYDYDWYTPSSSSTYSWDWDDTESEEMVTVIDFSKMDVDEIYDWCIDNYVHCLDGENYSDTVKKGGFVSQSVKPGEEVAKFSDVYIIYSKGKQPELTKEYAVEFAQSTLDKSGPWSRSALIDVLTYEGFSKANATYGVDHIGADWYEQAYLMASDYVYDFYNDEEGLFEQLLQEGYTEDQAYYALEEVGW